MNMAGMFLLLMIFITVFDLSLEALMEKRCQGFTSAVFLFYFLLHLISLVDPSSLLGISRDLTDENLVNSELDRHIRYIVEVKG